jgi:hypothetical protein
VGVIARGLSSKGAGGGRIWRFASHAISALSVARRLVISALFCKLCGMSRWFAITRVLAVLAILGLIVGSFVAPAGAKPADSAAVTMAGDMPCCHGNKAPDCAKGCPLAIMCFTASLSAGAAPAIAAPRLVSFNVTIPHDDAVMNGVGGSPPRRPPRT